MSNFTYHTLSGKSRPRRFVLVAGFILLVALLVWAGAKIQHAVERSQIMSTPQTLGTSLSTSTPRPTTQPLSPTPTAVSCPRDPGEWQLWDIFPDNHLRGLQPTCVYDELALVMAWHLFTRLGASGTEAATALGLPDLPVGPSREQIAGLTGTGDPQQMPLTHDVFHPDYHFWLVDSSGNPAGLAYSLRGCYRPSSVIGDQVTDWGSGYEVICMVAFDRNSDWIVHQFGDQVYAAQVAPLRQFYLWGYAETNWILIGAYKDVYTLISEPEKFELDRAEYTRRTQALVWDTDWLTAQFGLEMQVLPNDWQAYNDPVVLQAILAELNEAQP